MLGLKYTYLIIKIFDKDSFEFFLILKIKKLKNWLWRRNRRKII